MFSITTADAMNVTGPHLQSLQSSLHISCFQISLENQTSREISGVFLNCHHMWKTENTIFKKTVCPKVGKIYAANKNPNTSIWDVTWTLPILDFINGLAFSNRRASGDGSTSIQVVPNFDQNQPWPCGERKIFSLAGNQTLIFLSASSQISHYKDWVILVHGNSLFKAWISSLRKQKYKILSSKSGYFLEQFI